VRRGSGRQPSRSGTAGLAGEGEYPHRSLCLLSSFLFIVYLIFVIIVQELSMFSKVEVLQFDPRTFVNDHPEVRLLPPGRLNGLEHMLRLVQALLVAPKPHPDPKREATHITERLGVNTRLSDGEDFRKHEIAVLLSGGVDSSVALHKLLQQGHRVRAYYLKIWLEDELAHLNECPWEEDLQYASSVCQQLGVPLETLSLQKEYWDQVVQHTLDQARAGFTPNPDILCNSRIKFGMFVDYVGKYHEKIATGHYADTTTVNVLSDAQLSILTEKWKYSTMLLKNHPLLMQNPDPVKDQSYFLCDLSAQQLQRCVFPLADMQKSEVREYASLWKLPTKFRKDSQGICFLGKLKFNDFLKHYLGEKFGEIRDYSSNELVGRHQGLWFHTLGQRKGLGPLLTNVVHSGPWFVARKDIEHNTLYVTNDLSRVRAPRCQFWIDKFRWSLGIPPIFASNSTNQISIQLKLRHGPLIVSGILERIEDRWRVTLDVLDKGIAPGQFAVIYEAGMCLGCGVISDIGSDK
jgi:tRNA-5-taurinomethyluridine 2-sulfurtransferase